MASAQIIGVGQDNKRHRLQDRTTWLEDVVVSVLSSVMIGQSQEVYVNVNIYVSDVMRGEAYEENSLRLAELSRLAYEVLNAGNVDGFRITLAEQKTYDVAGLNEHMINNKVLYQYCNE